LVYLDEERVQSLLNPSELIAAIETAFTGTIESPPRTHHKLPGHNAPTLLLMPAWRGSHTIGVKLITVDPARRGTPTVEGIYILLDGTTGVPTAILGARALTAARTAAVSALAASYLAPQHASNLLIVGTGNLAPYLIQAHRSVRPIQKIMLWGRSPEKVKTLVDRLGDSISDIKVEIVTNLSNAIPHADIITCATASQIPIIFGQNVSPSTHVDLIGSFTPKMREADNVLFQRGRLIVDTMDALAECGDLIEPRLAGLLDASSVSDLAAMLKDKTLQRRNENEITIFKSVGTAIADLAAAEYFLAQHLSTTQQATRDSHI
jgi:alanine dehydrogenase